jgi:hypothetical protein
MSVYMKKLLLVLILILIVASCLFPPWIKIWNTKQGMVADRGCSSVGYGWLWTPPRDASAIDFGRLGIQLGLLIFLGCCVVFSKYIFPKTQPKPKPAPSDEQLPKKKREWIKNALVFICILVAFGCGAFATMAYLYTENQYSKLAVKQERAKDTIYEEVLADLDSEYGADCRNAAVEMFNALASKGKVPDGNPAMATRIMERCYKEAKAKQPVKKSHINTELLDAIERGEPQDVIDNIIKAANEPNVSVEPEPNAPTNKMPLPGQ